jgi:hypothetical protein
MNYRAPLLDKIEETGEEHKEMNAVITKQPQLEPKPNKYRRRWGISTRGA